jgi:hypothetical protein
MVNVFFIDHGHLIFITSIRILNVIDDPETPEH